MRIRPHPSRLLMTRACILVCEHAKGPQQQKLIEKIGDAGARPGEEGCGIRAPDAARHQMLLR
jgi:hypothetical protein